MMENIGIEARIFVWIISTLIGSLTGYIVKRTIYQDIELIPISMDKDQFEEFYQATQKPLTIVNWFMILSVLAQFIESFVYLIFGIFMVDFIYLLNTLVLTLLLLSGVHLRWKIFREIKHFFMS